MRGQPWRGRAFFVHVTRKDRRITHRLFRTERQQEIPGNGREKRMTNHLVVSSSVESELCTGKRVPARDVVFTASPEGKVLSYDDLAELERGSVPEVLQKAGFEVVGLA